MSHFHIVLQLVQLSAVALDWNISASIVAQLISEASTNQTGFSWCSFLRFTYRCVTRSPSSPHPVTSLGEEFTLLWKLSRTWRSTRKRLVWRSTCWRRSMKRILIINCEFLTVSLSFPLVAKDFLCAVHHNHRVYLPATACRCMTGSTTMDTCASPSSYWLWAPLIF